MTEETAPPERVTVRVRGIYSTAMTQLLANDDAAIDVVQASEAIQNRFDTEFGLEPADVTITTTEDRQGIGVYGDEQGVAVVADRLDVARDTFCWRDRAPQDAVFNGVVTETLGSGAIVDIGDARGFLPYGNTEHHVEEDDQLRVQVAEPSPPWSSDRPVLETTLSIHGELLTLVRGASANRTGAPELADLLPTDPREGWRIRWGRQADDASLDALDAALTDGNERVGTLQAALSDAPDAAESAPHLVWEGTATRWSWFGRESRFALDDYRNSVTTTMAGHHRIKAGDEHASTAVDFLEAICDDVTVTGDFPFAVVTQQFGPAEGDQIAIDHGKPDGRSIRLGRGEVTSRDPEGTIRVKREMSPGGTYDALGLERQAGDVAITKLTEGKWWYPTVYRDAEGEKRGTYVNVCTPVEIFPNAVRYVDLHVDVVKHADGTVKRVDDDELDAAVGAGHVSDALATKARNVATAIENAL